MALSYLHPGVYVEEVPGGTRSIQALGTSVAAFVAAARGEKKRPLVTGEEAARALELALLVERSAALAG